MAKLTEEELLFRKVEEKVKKAIFEYGLIVDGDRILIGLSGGKDSLALVDLLGRRSKIFRPRFEVIVTHIVMSNIPYRSDIDYLKSRADEHGLSFFVHETSFDRYPQVSLFPLFLDAAESLVRYCKEAWLQQDRPRASSGRYSRNPSDEHDPPGSDRNDATAPKDG